MSVRLTLLASVIGLSLPLLTGCRQAEVSATASSKRPLVRVVHAWGDGSPLTEVFRKALAESIPDIDLEVAGTNASVTNVVMLSRADVDVAFTFSDAAYMASVGQLPEIPQAFDDIRAIAALPTRALQVLVGPRSRIKTISDLRGGHVSLGPPGSGAALTSAFVLGAFGLSLDDLTAERLEFRDGAERVVSGDLDAAFWNGTFPNVNIAEAVRHGAHLLAIVGPDIERLRLEYPFLNPSVIPAGAYAGIDRPIHTVGVDGIVVCRANLDEAVVHELTRALLDVVARPGLDLPAMSHMNVSRASSTPIPLHPGAARYYREQELLR